MYPEAHIGDEMLRNAKMEIIILLDDPFLNYEMYKNEALLQQTRVARSFLTQYTKTRESILNYHNITKWPQNIPNYRKMFLMTKNYI
jgi:hypothetical protein